MTSNSVKLFFISIGNINGYIGEGNENKYLTIVPTYKSKYALKNMEKCGAKSKILLIRSINSDSDDYNEKYAKMIYL